jgi:hypothetical protein
MSGYASKSKPKLGLSGQQQKIVILERAKSMFLHYLLNLFNANILKQAGDATQD